MENYKKNFNKIKNNIDLFQINDKIKIEYYNSKINFAI